MYVALYHFFRIMSILGSHFLTGFWYILQYFEGLGAYVREERSENPTFRRGKRKAAANDLRQLFVIASGKFCLAV